MTPRPRNVSALASAFAFASALTLVGLAGSAAAQVLAPEPANAGPTANQPASAPAPTPLVTMPPAVPSPAITNLPERSGHVGRFVPIEPRLPPDPRRDHWYDTRWGDPPNRGNGTHPNFYRNGGLYGIPWKANHTASIYPYFFGAPGENTLNADVRRVGYLERLPRMILHPFKPVGMYYDQGSYVPVYDLDPIVSGPTAWPFPFFRRITSAGG
jgi:hypothetical protein